LLVVKNIFQPTTNNPEIQQVNVNRLQKWIIEDVIITANPNVHADQVMGVDTNLAYENCIKI